MKHLNILLLLTIGSCSLVHAQISSLQQIRDEYDRTIKDTTEKIPLTWKTGGIYNLTFNQAALSNWAAGGTILLFRCLPC